MESNPPTQIPNSRKRFPNYLVFLFSALVVAVVAAVIGGLAGKTIKHHSRSTIVDEAKASAARNPLTTITVSISVTTPTAIHIPTTSCPALNGHTLQSTYANITYKLTCNVDWVGYDISAASTNTISACGRACSTINLYKNRTCGSHVSTCLDKYNLGNGTGTGSGELLYEVLCGWLATK